MEWTGHRRESLPCTPPRVHPLRFSFTLVLNWAVSWLHKTASLFDFRHLVTCLVVFLYICRPALTNPGSRCISTCAITQLFKRSIASVLTRAPSTLAMTSMSAESVATILVSCKQTRFRIENPNYREVRKHTVVASFEPLTANTAVLSSTSKG